MGVKNLWQKIRRLWLRPTSIYQATLQDVGDPAGMIVRSWVADHNAKQAVADFHVWLEQRMDEFEKECGEV